MVLIRRATVKDRHCERSEAIHDATRKQEWIASWSLSSGARSRDPLARNDEVKKAGIAPGLRLLAFPGCRAARSGALLIRGPSR
jgi:hypothetical protein